MRAVKTEMAALDEYQVIDEVDADQPQELHRLSSATKVRIAWPRVTGRVVMRHQYSSDVSAKQIAPGVRRDDATITAITLDRFQSREPTIGVEASENHGFSIGQKQRAQQVTRDCILGFA